MQVIRQNVFETNSSSSHSVTITVETEGMYTTLEPDGFGNITLNGGDFSRPEYYIQSTKEKANAIAVYCAVTRDSALMKTFESLLREQTGAAKVVTNIRLLGPDRNSYMSSEFLRNLGEAVASKRDMKNFIFLDKSNISAVFGYDG